MSKATPLQSAAGLGEDFKVQDLVKSGKAGDVNAGDAKGWTALHTAVAHNHDGVVEILLKDGKANSNVKDRDSTTPLHVAAAAGNAKVVNTLLQHGAQVGTKNRNGETALMLAVSNNTPNALITAQNLIAGGANVNEKNNSGRTALHLAVRAGSVPVVQLLIAQGAKKDVADNLGMSVKDFAEGNQEIINLL
jgi:ankyrin repeat protein